MILRPAAIALASSLLLLLGGSLPSSAQVVAVDVLLDIDDDAGTGCILATADGALGGVDQLVQIEVDPGLAEIHEVWIADCVAPETNSFGAPGSVPGASTPIGVGLGNGGASVAEVVLPTVALAPRVRAGVAVGAAGDALITTDGTLGGLPIRFGPAGGVPVPSLGGTALGLLATLLVFAGAWLLVRRFPQTGRAMIFLLVLGTASVVWAIVVADGQPSDWTGPPDAIDATSSTDPAADLQAFFGRIEDDGTIALRVDAFFGDEPASCPIDPVLSCATTADCNAAAGTGSWQCSTDGCCECAPGFSGANCDCQDGACDPTTCPYQDGSGRAACTCSGQCVCIGGYGGPGCEVPPSACTDGCNWEQGGGTCGGPWQPTGSTADPTCVCSADWESPATSCNCFVGDADCPPVTRTQVTCSMECACATGDDEWCGLCPGETDPDGNFYLGGGSGPCPWP